VPYQNLDVSLPAADVAAIKAAVKTIEDKLPFLVTLTPDERKNLFKIGGGERVAFVQNSLTAAKNNPGVLPGAFSAPAFEKDVALYAALSDVLGVLRQLVAKVDDTTVAAGSEAVAGAAQVYNYVKTAAKTTPGLKAVADQLGQQFKQKSGGDTTGGPAAPPAP